MGSSSPIDPAPLQRPPKARVWSRIDRRLVRSGLYSALTLLLFVTFKASEWLLEHHLAAGKTQSVVGGLLVALSLGMTFQIFHKRVEHVVEAWLGSAVRSRRAKLLDLSKEVALIRDLERACIRVAERIDQVMNVSGSAVYIKQGQTFIRKAPDLSQVLPAGLEGDEPSIIALKLKRKPLVPSTSGSTLQFPLIWPIFSGEILAGVVALGMGDHKETLEGEEIETIASVADALGRAMGTAIPFVPDGVPLALPDRPSIVVLPFRNMGGDPEQSVFTDGIVEEITTALSRFQWLFVIAGNSAAAYKGRSVEIRRVATELGVRYVLEGSVRKSGSTVRIAAQLIDASSDAHIWAERMDGQLEDVFALQDALASAVVSAVVPKMQQAEIRRVLSRPQHKQTAYEAYIQGLALQLEDTKEANTRALEYFREAIRIDPGFALAYARAARCFQLRRAYGWTDDPAAETPEACRLARRALELGRDDPVVMGIAGFVLAWICREFDLGSEYVLRAVELNPNFAEGWALSGWVHSSRGQYDLAIAHIDKAFRLSPLDPEKWRWQFFMAVALFYARRFEEASTWAERVLVTRPEMKTALNILTAANGFAGNLERAKWGVEQILKRDPQARISRLYNRGPHPPEDEHLLEEGLRKAGLPE